MSFFSELGDVFGGIWDEAKGAIKVGAEYVGDSIELGFRNASPVRAAQAADQITVTQLDDPTSGLDPKWMMLGAGALVLVLLLAKR